MTPSRSSNTAFMGFFCNAAPGLQGTTTAPCTIGGIFEKYLARELGCQGKDGFLAVVAMVVGESAVPRNDIENHFASFKIEAKFELSEACRAHHFPQARPVLFAVEHEEASPSGARDFPPDRPILLCEIVPRLDLGVRNSLGEA